jgi:tetratricopeptide (TPR) repeat protein
MWRWLEVPYVNFTMMRAYRRLSKGDQKGAMAIAGRLKERRYPPCYEFIADIHLSEFDSEAAVAVLREGSAQCPGDHALRLRLAAALSDAGYYDEALSHIDAAQAMPDAAADRLSLDYNRAIILARRGDLDEALEISRRLLSDPELPFTSTEGRCLIHAVHVGFLAKSGQAEAAIRFHEANVGGLDMATDDARPEQAEVWETYARALVDAGRFADAEAAVQNGLDQDFSHADLFGVWRLMHGGSPDIERDYMQIFVISDGSRSGKPQATCLVAADDVEEALDFIRVFMPEPLRESLSAWHVQHYERRPMAKGVYTIKPLPP